MPDAKAISIEIRPSASWRLAVLVMTLSAALGLGWWSVTAFQRGAPGLIWLGMPAWLAIAAAASLLWPHGGRLRWDGAGWHLDLAAGGTAGERPGEMAIALDGGSWMLLRVRTARTDSGLRVRWLALSRRDLGSQWHALRCAVYSPRPEPAGRPAQAPATPSA